MAERNSVLVLAAALVAAGLPACARPESSQLAAQAAPAAGSTAAQAAGGSNGAAPVPGAPAPEPKEEARREAIRRQAQEIISGLEQDEKHGAGGQAGSTATPERLLGAYTQQDVVRAAGTSVDPSSSWRTAEWRGQPDTIVALSFRHAEFGARPEALDAQLVVVQSRSGKLAAVAQKKLDLSKADCRNDSGEPAGGEDRAPELALDLARYGIAPGQTAIGVRFTCANTFPAGEGSETRLLLLELRDGALRQVFDESIARTNFDRPTGNASTATGILSVRREQQAGHFGLQLRTKTKIEGADPATSPKDARQALERSETVRFVWKGDRYVSEAAR